MSLIDRMLAGGENLRQHAETLLGPRQRGSTTSGGLDQLDPDTIGDEFQPPEGVGIPGCRYLEFAAPGIDGRLGAVPLEEALAANLPVRVRNGKHGYELFVDRDPSEAAMPKTDTITVILGPHDTGDFPEVVWTWHPGKPLGTLRAPMSASTAVKLHNG